MLTNNVSCAAAYPAKLQWGDQLRDGGNVFIRSIDESDAPLEQAFLSRISPEYRAYRFLGLIKGPSNSVAAELTHIPKDEVALIALSKDGKDEIEIGAARFRITGDGTRCDCAVTVDPAWHRHGVGNLLMQHLIEIALSRGIRHMYAVDAARCGGTHKLAERLGFRSRPDPEDPTTTTFELSLDEYHGYPR